MFFFLLRVDCKYQRNNDWVLTTHSIFRTFFSPYWSVHHLWWLMVVILLSMSYLDAVSFTWFFIFTEHYGMYCRSRSQFHIWECINVLSPLQHNWWISTQLQLILKCQVPFRLTFYLQVNYFLKSYANWTS
jgi:hypothetical protein